jgi:hypothetical protein
LTAHSLLSPSEKLTRFLPVAASSVISNPHQHQNPPSKDCQNRARIRLALPSGRFSRVRVGIHIPNMPNTQRFFNVWPKSNNKLMFMKPKAEHLSFEARLERRQVSTLSSTKGDRSSTTESRLLTAVAATTSHRRKRQL